MWLVCKKCKDNREGQFHLAKFYPSGSFIAGDGAGWYVSNDKLKDDLDSFFELHQHDFDKFSFGGCQYELQYSIVNDGSDPIEKIFNLLSKCLR